MYEKWSMMADEISSIPRYMVGNERVGISREGFNAPELKSTSPARRERVQPHSLRAGAFFRGGAGAYG